MKYPELMKRLLALHSSIINGRDRRSILEAIRTIEEHRGWIKEQGRQSFTCTFNALGDICDGCTCHRKPDPIIRRIKTK